MQVVMMTNTYLPHVGGVARSVETVRRALLARGHPVTIVAPDFDEAIEDEDGVIRLAALQNFNGSDFSVRLPLPNLLTARLEDFGTELVHSHHPFLLGDTALRVAASLCVPIVFTHHTLYERFTQYVPGDSPALKRFTIRLATDYANLCDHVIAPSQSIAKLLRARGVTTPMTAIPTGIDPAEFADGDRVASRRRCELPTEGLVVGHVGRLAPEKNLPFLARAVARFLHQHPDARFLVVGDGPAGDEVRQVFRREKLSERLHMTGVMSGEDLRAAYHAMDVFAFASTSETQGMVLAEAMMAGVPVVAIDAPGAREIVVDRENGRLLESEDEASFAQALGELAELTVDLRAACSEAARRTAEAFSVDACTERVLTAYEEAREHHAGETVEDDAWHNLLERIKTEWQLWTDRGEAVIDSLLDED